MVKREGLSNSENPSEDACGQDIIERERAERMVQPAALCEALVRAVDDGFLIIIQENPRNRRIHVGGITNARLSAKGTRPPEGLKQN